MQLSQKITRETIILFIITTLGFILYARCINNAFLSDDYDSLYRIIIEKRIIYREFFRPIIDISFYLNYMLSGLDPGSYYVFNIMIHVFNTYMIYRLVLCFGFFEDKRQMWFAIASALLFMFYPFHNESIVWLSGRLSSIASLCALLAIWFSITGRSFFQAIILPALLFIVALLAYESVIFLPAMLIVLKFVKGHTRKSILLTGIVFGVSLVMYLGARSYFSSVIDNDGYGTRLVSGNGMVDYLGRVVKAFGRSFLPPMQDTKTITLAFIIACAGIIIIEFFTWRSLKNNPRAKKGFIVLLLLFAIALLLPAIFGVNTRTSEGDRLLYFPSCFLVMHIGFVLCSLVKNVNWRFLSFSIISFYFIFFQQRNNQKWEKASDTANALMSVAGNSEKKSVVLVNVPDDINGAFVFRHGFFEALELNKIDTARVILNNYLVSNQQTERDGVIVAAKEGTGWLIRPSSRILFNDGSGEIINLETGMVHFFKKEDNFIYYWDRVQLRKLY